MIDTTLFKALHQSYERVADEMFDLFKDKSIDQAVRWAAYEELCGTGYTRTENGDGFCEILGFDNPMEGMYMERYETRGYLDVPGYIDTDKIPEETWELWREAVLQSGYTDFTWDW